MKVKISGRVKCPLKIASPCCMDCLYSKEGLCDFPHELKKREIQEAK